MTKLLIHESLSLKPLQKPTTTEHPKVRIVYVVIIVKNMWRVVVAEQLPAFLG